MSSDADESSAPYFEKFEHRRPPPPLQLNATVHSIGQILLVIAVVTGAWYLHWRWTDSLNFEALWFALPLVVAETGAYIGLLLYAFNVWHVQDTPKQAAPHCISECQLDDDSVVKRPISVDVFFPLSLIHISEPTRPY